MRPDELVDVEVAYATPERQNIVAIKVPDGTTVATAIEISGLLSQFPEIDLSVNKVGVFACIYPLSHVLQQDDRVEIYRPLIYDPKESRRKRAAK